MNTDSKQLPFQPIFKIVQFSPKTIAEAEGNTEEEKESPTRKSRRLQGLLAEAQAEAQFAAKHPKINLTDDLNAAADQDPKTPPKTQRKSTSKTSTSQSPTRRSPRISSQSPTRKSPPTKTPTPIHVAQKQPRYWVRQTKEDYDNLVKQYEYETETNPKILQERKEKFEFK